MAKPKAVKELKANLMQVNSVGLMVPSKRLSSRKSSLAPMRKVETQSAKRNGGTRFTRSGTSGASKVSMACRPIKLEPTADRTAATPSMRPMSSSLANAASKMVHITSVDCNKR